MCLPSTKKCIWYALSDSYHRTTLLKVLNRRHPSVSWSLCDVMHAQLNAPSSITVFLKKPPDAFVLELYIHTCLCKHIPTPPHVPSSHGRVVPARDFAGDSDSVVVPCAVPSPVACSKNKERQKTDRDSATKPDERTTKEHRSVEFVKM